MKAPIGTATTALLLCAALTACTGTAPAPSDGGATQAAVSTAAPAAAAPGSTDAQTQGPVTWDIHLAPGDITNDVVSIGAVLVAVGSAGTSPDGDTAGVWTSPDGRTWEPATVIQPAGTMSAVAGRPGRLVAVGYAPASEGMSGPAAWTSDDGGTWQPLAASAFAGSSGYEPVALADVVTGPGGFVVVGSETGAGGQRAAAWYSADGLAWTHTQSNLGGDSAGQVVRRGTGYVAAGWVPGEDGDAWAIFWSSPDGRSWSAAPDSAELHDVGSTPHLAATLGHLVAIGYPSHAWVVDEPTVWTSWDAVAWVRQAKPGLVAPLPAVPEPSSGQAVVGGLAVGGLIAVEGGFVASGEAYLVGPGAASSKPNRVVWTSATGESWSVAAELPAMPDVPDSDGALVGTLVEHQGLLFVFGQPNGMQAPLWVTDLQNLLASSR